tara:strand:+ start:2055 stop:2414 length:360 start_codon:yes stop_codon:yes gene_type:complete
MNLGNLTYQQINQLEENLSNPEFQKLHYLQEYLIKILIQTLRQNRYLADTVASADMRSRLAFGNSVEDLEKLEKFENKYRQLKNDVDFMLGLVTGIKRGKQKSKRKIRGIQIGTRTDTE